MAQIKKTFKIELTKLPEITGKNFTVNIPNLEGTVEVTGPKILLSLFLEKMLKDTIGNNIEGRITEM